MTVGEILEDPFGLVGLTLVAGEAKLDKVRSQLHDLGDRLLVLQSLAMGWAGLDWPWMGWAGLGWPRDGWARGQARPAWA